MGYRGLTRTLASWGLYSPNPPSLWRGTAGWEPPTPPGPACLPQPPARSLGSPGQRPQAAGPLWRQAALPQWPRWQAEAGFQRTWSWWWAAGSLWGSGRTSRVEGPRWTRETGRTTSWSWARWCWRWSGSPRCWSAPSASPARSCCALPAPSAATARRPPCGWRSPRGGSACWWATASAGAPLRGVAPQPPPRRTAPWGWRLGARGRLGPRLRSWRLRWPPRWRRRCPHPGCGFPCSWGRVWWQPFGWDSLSYWCGWTDAATGAAPGRPSRSGPTWRIFHWSWGERGEERWLSVVPCGLPLWWVVLGLRLGRTLLVLSGNRVSKGHQSKRSWKWHLLVLLCIKVCFLVSSLLFIISTKVVKGDISKDEEVFMGSLQ